MSQIASILMWVVIGIFLGTLYTLSIRLEINQVAKESPNILRRNPLFSIGRITLTSTILVFAFSQGTEYGFAGLAAFLLSKYISLLLVLKQKQKGV